MKIKETENNMKSVFARPYEGEIEYEMTKQMAKQILVKHIMVVTKVEVLALSETI